MPTVTSPGSLLQPLIKRLRRAHYKSQKAVNFTHYRWLAINLSWLALSGQTVKNFRRLAYETEWVAKRTDNLRRLASPFSQSLVLLWWPDHTGRRKTNVTVDRKERWMKLLILLLNIPLPVSQYSQYHNNVICITDLSLAKHRLAGIPAVRDGRC